MNLPINQPTIEQWIRDEIEESLTLDYKAADALGKSDGKKKEITKDVSAMANSAGGLIIYGIRESKDPSKKNKPDSIDPVSRNDYPKEWLEHVINNVRPRIDGVRIWPVRINTHADHVVYVVEIPQSTTAHQALDFRYYKRFNFESTPMYDYEIQDVMGRVQHPKITLDFELEIETWSIGGGFGGFPKPDKEFDSYFLSVHLRNDGQKFARYVNAFITIPARILHSDELRLHEVVQEKGSDFCRVETNNRFHEEFEMPMGLKKYGPEYYRPILPGLGFRVARIRLDFGVTADSLKDLEAAWLIHADDASPNKGVTGLTNVRIRDKRLKANEEPK